MPVPRSEAYVTPGLLRWARERADLTVEAVAKKLGTKSENVVLWEDGKKKPTFSQAQNFADATNVPFGYLYLERPPVERLPIPDLRTVGSIELRKLSLNLRDVVRDAIGKQEWLIEHLRANDEATALPFVGKFRPGSAVRDVVADMRRVLQVGDDLKGSGDEFMRLIIRSAEDRRIIVLRSGVVGSNTHRKLDVKEFRGFSIVNKVAPLVFINSADAPTARLFTLAHELAHLWVGESGISDVSIKSSNKIEKACNAIAGEFLVPGAIFRALWDKEADWESEVRRLAPKFHVSKLVIARRAKDLNFISTENYQEFYESELKSYRLKNAEKEGGDPYRTASARNGALISRLVLNEALSGRMLLRDASRMLGVKPSNLPVLAKKIEL
jgi:Zn-dependent peptidase ImmA (M78 family)/DNA-binding XRE family transcriptional regulator